MVDKRGMKNSKAKNSSGQMQIGFGVIFSIILIVIFIAFTIYAIGKFMSIRTTAQVEKFKSDLQLDIDRMWKSTSGSQEVAYYLPNKVKQVCFMNDIPDMNGKPVNSYFVPIGEFANYSVKNVDMTKTLAASRTNPKTLCINIANGKVAMTIKKAYNEQLITITK